MTAYVETQQSRIYTCSIASEESKGVTLAFTPANMNPLDPGTVRVRPYASLIDPQMPSQTGCSFVGRVIETGVNQTRLRTDDWVIGLGPLATQITVPATQCITIPPTDNKTAVTWAMCLSILPCIRSAAIQLGESTAILGYNLVAKLIAQFAYLSGSTRILILDPTGTPDGQAGPPLHRHISFEALEERQVPSAGQVNVLIDTLGDVALIQSALPYVRQRGRVLLMGNEYPTQATLDFYPEIHKRSLKLWIRPPDRGLAYDEDRRSLASSLEAILAFYASDRLAPVLSMKEIALRSVSMPTGPIHVGTDAFGLVVHWPVNDD